MGSVKLKDLKAYVRYDGSGRVVAGSLVFRKKKPKNGRWVEITKNQCCNAEPIPSSSSTTTTSSTTTSYPTTTTTTSHGGSNPQPTAFVKQIWTSPIATCSGGAMSTLLFYSASSTLTVGVSVFLDAALTIPVTDDYVIYTESVFPGMFVNYIVQNGILTDFSCLGLYWFASDKTTACSQTSPAQFIPVSIAGNNIAVGVKVFGEFSNYGYTVPGTVYMSYNPGPAATAVIVLLSGTSGIIVEAPLTC